jgi:hypothetical protein
MLAPFDTQSRQEEHMGRRAEILAKRIEEGAAGLAAFAEKLTDAEWKTPMSVGNDRRPVGVIVNHVAFVYPIELDLAKGIASGKAVDVTWEAVADLNSKHAKDTAATPKAETIALLKKNSREAAEAVRAFTDEMLDGAAPFGLAYGAPVTAQFVLEDHPVRHSWHHLAKIKKVLGK